VVNPAEKVAAQQAANARTIRTPETALNQAVDGPLNGSFTAACVAAGHRRQHRSGLPSRIDTDPELQAFIRDGIDPLTYRELVAEIATAFPKDRRIGKSVLSRWSIAQRSKGKIPLT